ncbi:MAG: hypothetical protein ACOYJ1_13620 [Peptococcales bacterium]|jgi:hypothetical protein
MVKLERREEFLKGSFAGVVGAIAKYGFNELAQFLQLSKYDNNATAITVIMKGYEHNIYFWLFGFITALMIGAFFGVMIAFMYTYVFSERRIYLKAIGIGIGIWLINFGVFSRIFSYPTDIKYRLGDVLSMLISLIIFSLITVITLKRIGLFTNNSNKKKLKRNY